MYHYFSGLPYNKYRVHHIILINYYTDDYYILNLQRMELSVQNMSTTFCT